jgi:hypothetical protein
MNLKDMQAIKFNKRLFWDYDISNQDLEKEDVLIFYISRILNNGTIKDVKEIPIELIEKYIDRLNLSTKVRKFWEWYLKE